MPVRYTVTETSGHQHERTSAGHRKPEYFFAVVRSPGCRKSLVSYHSTRQLAEAAFRDSQKPVASNAFTREHYPHRIGKPTYPDAILYPVTAEVR